MSEIQKKPRFRPQDIANPHSGLQGRSAMSSPDGLQQPQLPALPSEEMQMQMIELQKMQLQAQMAQMMANMPSITTASSFGQIAIESQKEIALNFDPAIQGQYLKHNIKFRYTEE